MSPGLWGHMANLYAVLETSELENFPSSSAGKESAYNARDPGSLSGSEKQMATHSSILAWRIPWTEEPGRLLSIGSQKSDTT